MSKVDHGLLNREYDPEDMEEDKLCHDCGQLAVGCDQDRGVYVCAECYLGQRHTKREESPTNEGG